MNDNMTDGEWIEANPTRHYRIRRRGAADDLGLIAAAIVRIASPDRRMWSTRIIRMRDELPDTDEVAAQALQEHEAIFAARLGKVHGQPMSARAVLNKLRQDATGHA